MIADDKKNFLIIDSHSVLHRAFHALPLLTTKKGEAVNAAYGFCLVFLKALKEIKPSFVAAAFDLPGPTFRHKKYQGYKAKRPKTPEDLCRQIPKVKEILRSFNIPIFEKEGFEADDIIGTIAESVKCQMPNVQRVILSGDLDALQLIDEETKVYFLKKGVKDVMFYDKEAVKKRYQDFVPSQLIDFKALRGDPTDNIPGVPGIGEKTALKLIKEFGTLEKLYSVLDQDSFTKTAPVSINQHLRTKLIEHKEQAFLSRFLVQIQRDVPLEFNLERCQLKKIDKEKVRQVFENLEFYSLVKRINNDECLC